ncbi:hypothetical protein [Actinoplanes sp. NPDC026623]|uniref:hypothetical protein n=1 Tax=Actinoplanes sp. NPDC026623 TaxID=3155610 RepID=UPI0033C72FEC
MTTVNHDMGETFERLRFYPRQLISADDLNDEQEYHRQKLREHNRLLHGWGVVCGCDVQAAPTGAKPWQVRICAGYLLTPQGDAVSIRAEVLFDLADCFLQSKDPCAFARPCPPVTRRTLEQNTVYLAVRFVECQSRPVRTAPAGCSCDEDGCEYSRIRDAYEFCCLAELPETHKQPAPDCGTLLTHPRLVPCPGCPQDPWVVLATIELPESPRTAIEQVDPLQNRRQLYGTALLQDMIQCLDGR